jgi:predicted Zn-dependent peptidase
MRPLLPLLAALPLLAQEGAPVHLQLPTGLQATLWEDHEAALIRLEGLLPIRPGEVPPEQAGLPKVLLALLQASPKGNRSASEFQALLDRSGIRLNLVLTPEGFRLSLACRSRDQELALGLLGDFLGRSPLDPEALEPLRLRLLQRPEAPGIRAEREALRGSLDQSPPEAALARITFADLLTFKARVFRPDRLRLHLQGDLNRAQATQRLQLDLGAWNGTMAEAPMPGSLPAPAEAAVETEGPGHLLVTLALPEPSDPAGALLGLLLEGRLLGHGLPGDPWRLGVEAPTAAQALAAAEARLEGLRFTEADLGAAKLAWKGRQALLPLRPEAQLQERLRGQAEGGAVARLTLSEVDTALRSLRLRGFKLWRGPTAWLPKPTPKP